MLQYIRVIFINILDRGGEMGMATKKEVTYLAQESLPPHAVCSK